jgi:hypothetical protein
VTIDRYRRKPKMVDREDQVATRYEPGGSLDDLLAVARMADRCAEMAEVMFPSYGPVLLVRWTRVPDDRPSEPEYEHVEAGHYLVYSPGGGFLYESDDADWRQFYDLVGGGSAAAAGAHTS